MYSLTPDKPAEWGIYQEKPVAQSQWDDLVRATVAEIAELEPVETSDLRPFVKDQITGNWCLVDTGAAATVVPKYWVEGQVQIDPTVVLKAVNGSKILTYGRREVTFQLEGVS